MLLGEAPRRFGPAFNFHHVAKKPSFDCKRHTLCAGLTLAFKRTPQVCHSQLTSARKAMLRQLGRRHFHESQQALQCADRLRHATQTERVWPPAALRQSVGCCIRGVQTGQPGPANNDQAPRAHPCTERQQVDAETLLQNLHPKPSHGQDEPTPRVHCLQGLI